MITAARTIQLSLSSLQRHQDSASSTASSSRRRQANSQRGFGGVLTYSPLPSVFALPRRAGQRRRALVRADNAGDVATFIGWIIERDVILHRGPASPGITPRQSGPHQPWPHGNWIEIAVPPIIDEDSIAAARTVPSDRTTTATNTAGPAPTDTSSRLPQKSISRQPAYSSHSIGGYTAGTRDGHRDRPCATIDGSRRGNWDVTAPWSPPSLGRCAEKTPQQQPDRGTTPQPHCHAKAAPWPTMFKVLAPARRAG